MKRTVDEDGFNISNYEKDGSVTLLCRGGNSTDVQFMVEGYAGTEQCPIHIKDLKGNSPEILLKRQIDDNYFADFLFIGHFTDEITDLDESYSFYVDEWYTVGPIERGFIDFILYPSYGFNIFEVDVSAI